MTEAEYITSTNLAKFRMAEHILRDVMAGDEYGVPESEYREIVKQINKRTTYLYKTIELE